jgi:aryl-alcohol dehydrogenase-like predicted oxidoreductase
MDQQHKNAGKGLTRRELMRDGAIAAAGLTLGGCRTEPEAAGRMEKTRSYNPDMEYRPLGRTGLWISAVCLGGHWKRVDKMVPGVFKSGKWLSADIANEGFKKNRRDVVSKCIEVGINYIDACTSQECQAYAEALRGRRDAMYLGFSWYQEEMRKPQFRTAKALMGTLDKAMRICKLDYVDLWRPTMLEQSGRHTEGEVEEMMNALETAKKQGKCRLTGCSTHDRPHIKKMIEQYPDILQVVVTPYTAKSKVLPRDSMFDTMREYGTGMFGIKPFASTTLFKGDSSLDSPTREEDDERARLAIRYILCNPAVTAPIPGLINTQQVENMAKAVKERRNELTAEETKKLEDAMDEAWANLPQDYEWLKDWEYV